MSEVLKCAVCGQVIDQDKDIILLQNRLYGDFKPYVFCKDCNNFFETYIRPLMKRYGDLKDQNVGN